MAEISLRNVRYFENKDHSSKPLVIYHANCADGFTAAWCFWKSYGDDGAEYFPGFYQEPPPKSIYGRDVYLVDFSYKRDVVLDMLEKVNTLTLIDHHKSAIEDLAEVKHKKFVKYVDLERSGARLAWDFLYPGQKIPPLMYHIEDRDLWRFYYEKTREIQAAVFSYEYDFYIWDMLMSSNEVELQQLYMEGVAIERKHFKDVKELVKVTKRRMVISGYDVPVASLPYTLTSDAGNLMAKGEKFAACYWDCSDGRVFSLRSVKQEDGTSFDVAKIAEEYGGGGHLNASGFKVPRDHVLAVS